MEERIFVEPWPFQCCGDAFGIGDRVSWSVGPVDHDDEVRASMMGADLLATLAGEEDHHGLVDDADLRLVEGVVRSAGVVSCRSERRGRMLVPVPGTTVVEATRAEGLIDVWAERLGARHLVGIIAVVATDEANGEGSAASGSAT